ncbi:MAG: LexA family transcriptional regulator [Phycisphaerae bacterium]|nr:LexA family transcriptional regulator [Phycisphaerae bacterium]
MKKNGKKSVVPKSWADRLRLRCRQTREAAGISQAELAARAGLAGNTAVSNFESGRTDGIAIQMLSLYLEMADIAGVSPAWTLGLSDNASVQKREISTPKVAPNSILESSEWRVMETFEPGFEIMDVEQLPRDWSREYLPIIGRLAAGTGMDTTEAEEYPTGIAAQYLKFHGAPKNAFALRVQGASMQPEFFDGDIVIVDTRTVVSSGICAVVIDADGVSDARLKRLTVQKDKAILESLNPDYPPIRLPVDRIRCAYAIWRHLPAVRKTRNRD